jgi:adenosylmethionine-8-amino-7-oxononanoate aminotransferase
MMTITPQWVSNDKAHVWHPYTQMQLVPEAVPVESASGAYIELADGRRIFDAISSWWVTLHGHSHPTVARAIAEQAAKLEQVIFAGFTHQAAAVLAKELIAIAPPGLERVFFSDDGSTAVEVALKMCLQYWQHRGEERSLFLALDHSYHGDTFGAMSVSARGPFTSAFERHLFHVEHVPFPEPPEGCSDFSDEESQFLTTLEEACRTRKPAGFIYEPLLLGAGGMLMWRPVVLQQALEIAKRYGVPTIADEVLTGFGRTGTMFASERATITPTIMTLSKGLTAGFLPMGATLVQPEMYEAFLSEDRSRTFFHGHSYTGNALSCAAALASLQVFREEPVFQRIASIEHAHAKRTSQLSNSLNIQHRQIGTIVAFEPRVRRGYLSGDSIAIGRRALDRGVLLRPLGETLYVLPPYSATESDLDLAYDVIEELIGEGQLA